MAVSKKQITQWSYSRYSLYSTCPLKAKLVILDKMQEPKNTALVRGADVHEDGDRYVKGALTALPEEYQKFSGVMKHLKMLWKKKKAVAEESWAFTKAWTVVDNFAPSVWVRIKLDATVLPVKENDFTMEIIDYKTGRVRDDYTKQLELYACGGFHRFPEAATVRTRLLYLDSGEEREQIFHAKDRKKLVEIWDKRTKPLLTDKRFAPRPGDHCRWCHFRASNNGPCKF